MSIELRDYQQKAVDLVLEAYKQNPHGQELIVLPCAAGKTVVFSHVIDTLAREYGLLAMVVCHLDELTTQAADKYHMVKPDAVVGKVGSGVFQYGGELTVCGVDTISRPNHLKNLKALYGTGDKLIIVVDEAHLSAAKRFQVVLDAFPDAFVLFVTATPFRLDGKEIINKPPLYQRTIIEMVREGYLCNLKAIAIRTQTNLDDVRSLGGDFNEHDLDLAVNTPERNRRIVEAYMEHTPNESAIAFGVTIAHAEAMAYAFNDQGIASACITGKTPLPERQRFYKAFERGEILVLTSVNVLSIGFDSPRAKVAIMARPTQSLALYIQQAGRILRLFPGKHVATLLDITDNSFIHRIAPQNFKKALGLQTMLLPDETLLDALDREEAAANTPLIRKLNEKRNRDIIIDLLALPEWQENGKGMFVMEVGPERHRIALVPSKSTEGWFEVWARLAPNFEAQKWQGASPIDWAMQVAEKKAHLLMEGKQSWTDRNAPWREQKPSEGQMSMLDFIRDLKWYQVEIPASDTLTKGQASDLIDAYKTALEAKKAVKEKKEQEKQQQQAQTLATTGTDNRRAESSLYSQGFRMMR